MNEQQAGLYDYDFVHQIACCNRDAGVLASSMPMSRIIIHILLTALKLAEIAENIRPFANMAKLANFSDIKNIQNGTLVLSVTRKNGHLVGKKCCQATEN